MFDPTRSSFVAELHSRTSGYPGRIGVTPRSPNVTPVPWSGWLAIMGNDRDDHVLQAIRFRFDYRETRADRIHYAVSAVSDNERWHGKHLGVSRNGYLGFYSEEQPAFKLELINPWDGINPLDFYFRNADGERVGVYETQGVKMLNTQTAQADILQFSAVRILRA
ncbi:hypothetical protein ACIQUS_05620 [Pseudomonas sp. NPDC090755]|uniref:hypothetical protein n=1 Tax=Pseudomonas sp. NPDC090755 TaxID=3364481 RepID=UPI00383AA0B1